MHNRGLECKLERHLRRGLGELHMVGRFRKQDFQYHPQALGIPGRMQQSIFALFPNAAMGLQVAQHQGALVPCRLEWRSRKGLVRGGQTNHRSAAELVLHLGGVHRSQNGETLGGAVDKRPRICIESVGVADETAAYVVLGMAEDGSDQILRRFDVAQRAVKKNAVFGFRLGPAPLRLGAQLDTGWNDADPVVGHFGQKRPIERIPAPGVRKGDVVDLPKGRCDPGIAQIHIESDFGLMNTPETGKCSERMAEARTASIVPT